MNINKYTCKAFTIIEILVTMVLVSIFLLIFMQGFHQIQQIFIKRETRYENNITHMRFIKVFSDDWDKSGIITYKNDELTISGETGHITYYFDHDKTIRNGFRGIDTFKLKLIQENVSYCCEYSKVISFITFKNDEINPIYPIIKFNKNYSSKEKHTIMENCESALNSADNHMFK